MIDLYRKMLEDSPIAYVAVKFEGIENKLEYISYRVLDMNRSFELMYKVEKKTSINKIIDIERVKIEEEKEEWLRLYKESYENGKSVSKLFISRLSCHCNVEVYSDKDNVYHIRITKINDEVLKLSTIFKNQPYLAWIKDRNGIYVDANYAYTSIFNLHPKDMIGKTDYDIWGKKYADIFKSQDEHVMKERELCKYEDFLEINNIRHYVEATKLPYTDSNNEIVLGTIGIGMVTSDKTELRKNIEKNEKIFKEIANTIEEIIIIRDENKAHYISPAFEKIYGVSPEEMNIYEDIDNWFEYWDSVEFENDYRKENNIIKDIDKHTIKVSKEGKDDIWLTSIFSPIFDENGNIIKKIGVVRNITEAKKAQLEIDNMKMDFIINISHELRTPINLILSTISLINHKNELLDEKER